VCGTEREKRNGSKHCQQQQQQQHGGAEPERAHGDMVNAQKSIRIALLAVGSEREKEDE
jgi:hypothetical protein